MVDNDNGEKDNENVKKDKNTRMTPAQSISLERIKERVPKGVEIKKLKVFQPEETEVGDPQLAKMLLVQVEMGYEGDETEFKKALRTRATYLISPRGRIEPWGFGGGEE